MQDERFIIMKINSAGVAYGIINSNSIVFYGMDEISKKIISLEGMMDDIIDIPYYLKLLFEKGMDAVSTVEEMLYEENDDDEMYQCQIPFLQLLQGIKQYPNSQEIQTFNLDNAGTQLIIQIIPQSDAIYYNFTIVKYNRLIMDMVINPIDMLYIDTGNEYMHTMERGHGQKKFDLSEIVKFACPNIEFTNKQDNIIYI